MASVVEALNKDVTAHWSATSRLDISSQAHAYLEIKDSTNHLILYSDSDVYIRFDTRSFDTVDTTNDLILKASSFTDLRIPRGLGDYIVFHAKQVSSSASKYIRVVEG